MKFTITVPSFALEFEKKLLRKIIGQAGREIAQTAKALIGRGGAGRKYGNHVSSGAGSPPASLTGLLRASVRVKMRGDTVSIFDDALKSGSGKSAFYAIMLEAGAQGGGGKGSASIGRSHKRGGAKGKPQTKRVMAPRPFISTAAEGEMPSLQKRISQALSQSIDLKILAKR